MMTCRELTELLLDFVSGELAEEQVQRIKEHLDGCPPCYFILKSYHITIQLTRQLPCHSLPPPCEQRLRAAIAEQWRQHIAGQA